MLGGDKNIVERLYDFSTKASRKVEICVVWTLIRFVTGLSRFLSIKKCRFREVRNCILDFCILIGSIEWE